jgi:hypothetical protein
MLFCSLERKFGVLAAATASRPSPLSRARLRSEPKRCSIASNVSSGLAVIRQLYPYPLKHLQWKRWSGLGEEALNADGLMVINL